MTLAMDNSLVCVEIGGGAQTVENKETKTLRRPKLHRPVLLCHGHSYRFQVRAVVYIGPNKVKERAGNEIIKDREGG